MSQEYPSSPQRCKQGGFFGGGAAEEAVGELAFLGLELVDALFDSAFADELVDEDGLGLAEVVGAV